MPGKEAGPPPRSQSLEDTQKFAREHGALRLKRRRRVRQPATWRLLNHSNKLHAFKVLTVPEKAKLEVGLVQFGKRYTERIRSMAKKYSAAKVKIKAKFDAKFKELNERNAPKKDYYRRLYLPEDLAYRRARGRLSSVENRLAGVSLRLVERYIKGNMADFAQRVAADKASMSAKNAGANAILGELGLAGGALSATEGMGVFIRTYGADKAFFGLQTSLLFIKTNIQAVMRDFGHASATYTKDFISSMVSGETGAGGVSRALSTGGDFVISADKRQYYALFDESHMVSVSLHANRGYYNELKDVGMVATKKHNTGEMIDSNLPGNRVLTPLTGELARGIAFTDIVMNAGGGRKLSDQSSALVDFREPSYLFDIEFGHNKIDFDLGVQSRVVALARLLGLPHSVRASKQVPARNLLALGTVEAKARIDRGFRRVMKKLEGEIDVVLQSGKISISGRDFDQQVTPDARAELMRIKTALGSTAMMGYSVGNAENVWAAVGGVATQSEAGGLSKLREVVMARDSAKSMFRQSSSNFWMKKSMRGSSERSMVRRQAISISSNTEALISVFNNNVFWYRNLFLRDLR